MTKEKLFTPEDFDKPKDKSFWKKYKSSILGLTVFLIILVVVLCCIFSSKEQQKKKEGNKQTEQVTNQFEPQVTNNDAEGENTLAIEKKQGIENIKLGEMSIPVTKSIKTKVKQEATSLKRSSQFSKVSDNIEQEAMNVIRGNYGNIPERREKLGHKYNEIQNRVNQLKREGVF